MNKKKIERMRELAGFNDLWNSEEFDSVKMEIRYTYFFGSRKEQREVLKKYNLKKWIVRKEMLFEDLYMEANSIRGWEFETADLIEKKEREGSFSLPFVLKVTVLDLYVQKVRKPIWMLKLKWGNFPPTLLDELGSFLKGILRERG